MRAAVEGCLDQKRVVKLKPSKELTDWTALSVKAMPCVERDPTPRGKRGKGKRDK